MLLFVYPALTERKTPTNLQDHRDAFVGGQLSIKAQLAQLTIHGGKTLTDGRFTLSKVSAPIMMPLQQPVIITGLANIIGVLTRQ